MLVLVRKLLKFPKLIFLCQSLKLGSYCIYFRTCSTKIAIHIRTFFCVNHSHDHKTSQFCIGTFKWQKNKKNQNKTGKWMLSKYRIHFSSLPLILPNTSRSSTWHIRGLMTTSPERRAAVEVLKMIRPFPRESEITVWVSRTGRNKTGSQELYSTT